MEGIIMKRKLIVEVESQEALNELSKIKGITITSNSNPIPMNIQEIIDGIIEDFDFDRVHDVMEYMDWEWRGKGVPSVEKLKNESLNLLQQVYIHYLTQTNNEPHSIQMGRLEAYYENIDGEDCFELKFVLESVNNYY